jgi:receptor protein-tyrosine kinase
VLDRGRLAGFGIAIPSAARSRTVEEFRLIKRNLVGAWSQKDLMADRRASRLIMVTSARPGEGKTFTALNLALAFASERSVKALLVDVDTQHSTTPEILGIERNKGIVDVLAGNLELPEVLIQTNIPNLMILPAGRGGPHVPELLSSPEMGALLDEMTQRLPDHYLIIDTPPCMASSDAAALAPLVGQIVFVVEANNTQQGEIEAALSTLSTCPRISLLLNKSDSLATEHFGSYGYNYHSADSGSDEQRSAEIA